MTMIKIKVRKRIPYFKGLAQYHPILKMKGFAVIDTKVNFLLMSEEQLKAILEKIKSDTELKDKLSASMSLEEALSISQEAGFSITPEDVESMKTEVISDFELENAAGGYRRGGCGTCPPYGSDCQPTNPG